MSTVLRWARHIFVFLALLAFGAAACAEGLAFSASPAQESLKALAGTGDLSGCCKTIHCTLFNACHGVALVSSPAHALVDSDFSSFAALQPPLSAYFAEPGSPPPRSAAA